MLVPYNSGFLNAMTDRLITATERNVELENGIREAIAAIDAVDERDVDCGGCAGDAWGILTALLGEE